MKGLELKIARIRVNLKQGELALKLGITQNRLCQYELGRKPIPDSMARKIKHLLHVENGKVTFGLFHYVCWGVAFIVVALLTLDVTKIMVLSPHQLMLVAIGIALVLLPFARKLKIFGVEFERLKEDDRAKK